MARGSSGLKPLRRGTPEWNYSQPLVAAVLIPPKVAESLGSGRTYGRLSLGVIGALLYFFPSEDVKDQLYSP